MIRACMVLISCVISLSAQTGGRGGSIPQVPQVAHDCAASGTVVNAQTGEPIPRAMVTLNGADGVGSATDTEGRWSVANVACGPRIPQATHPGFVQPGQISALAQMKQRVDLVSGTPATAIKIELAPEASVAGRVQDDSGDPIDQAQIRVLRVVVQAGKRTLTVVGAAQVESNGNFRVGRLSPGRYVMCADSQRPTYAVGGGEPLVYRESCYPGPPESSAAIAMQIGAGREERVTFTLTSARSLHVRGSISGMPPRTQEETSQPRAQTMVELMPVQASFRGRSYGGQVSPDGTFDIGGVAPGTYQARVTQRTNQPGAVATGQADIFASNADVNGVAIALRAPGSVGGTVRYELSPAPQAGTGSAKPAPRPALNLNLAPPANGMGIQGPVPQATWDADHRTFEFAGVPAGQLRLNANVNQASAYVRLMTLRGQDITNQPFNIDGATGPIEIVVSDDTGGVDITVNDADGHPGFGSAMLLGANGRQIMLNSGNDGHATRKNIPTGDYRAWAFDDINTVPYAEDDWMGQHAGPGEKITVATGSTATATLKRIPSPSE